MKYLLLIHTPDPASSTKNRGDGPTVEEFMAFHKTITDAGVVLNANALDVAHATSVEVGWDGERVVTDGPFAETREMVGGYYLIDVPDLDAAIDWAARCPGARHGRMEIRTIWEPDFS
jgi:hypothetical protein